MHDLPLVELAPEAVARAVATAVAPDYADEASSAVLHRKLDLYFPVIARGEGCYVFLEDGRCILDASGGAAVACLGHGDKRVIDAMKQQAEEITYCATAFFTTKTYEALCQKLISTSPGHFSRAYIVSSGSEATEAAMKLARQYFLEKEKPEPDRARFISRRQSYHGITLGALSAGGHKFRRSKFEPLLSQNTSQVSPCYAYRGKRDGESDQDFVDKLLRELEDEFIRVGPDTVCGFIAEPVVGAALGCVPSVPGYFEGVRAICDKYGALLILDEVMCGMGRTGTMHAWQHDGVAPDIQTIGKGLGGGYQAVAGVLIHHRVVDALERGTGSFVHGHTYQGHPMACAAALQVQRIIEQDGLLANVTKMGQLLSSLLKTAISRHPNVGDIRGRGLFWGIEFVQDKSTKQPFRADAHVAMNISEMGLSKDYSMTVYPSSGTADGILGDHIILAPPFNVTEKEVHKIVHGVARLVNDYFAQMDEKLYLN